MIETKITAAIHTTGWTYCVLDQENHVGAHSLVNDEADAWAAEMGQRIIRNPDGSCTIQDLPREPTALELIDGWFDRNPHDNSHLLRAIRDAILAGRSGGPT